MLHRRASQDKIAARLEREAFYTSQRERRHNYEQRATPEKWAAILTAIISYQNKHQGASPTDLMVAKQTNMSVGIIQYHLREMEKEGLISDSKGWPRRISVKNVAKVTALTARTPAVFEKEEKVEEAKVMDSNDVKKRKQNKSFINVAREIGQAIIDHYDRHGSAPGVKDMERALGYASVGSVSLHIKHMVQLGWLYHKPRHHNDLALTGAGRAALFGQIDNQLHTDTPVNPQPRVVRAPPPAPMPKRVEAVPVEEPVQLRQERSVPQTVERRRPSPVTMGDLGSVEDVDLVIELTGRGYRVARN